jgi:hypothetical protein
VDFGRSASERTRGNADIHIAAGDDLQYFIRRRLLSERLVELGGAICELPVRSSLKQLLSPVKWLRQGRGSPG